MELAAGAVLVLYGLFHDLAASKIANPGRPWLTLHGGRAASETLALGPVGTTMATGATTGFALTGLGIGGVLVPAGFLPGLAIASGAMSVLLFMRFFRAWTIIPILLDLAVVAAIVAAMR